MADCAGCGKKTKKSYKIVVKHLANISEEVLKETYDEKTIKTTYSYDKVEEHFVGVCPECLEVQRKKNRKTAKMQGILVTVVSAILLLVTIFVAKDQEQGRMIGGIVFGLLTLIGIFIYFAADHGLVSDKPSYVAYFLATEKKFSDEYAYENQLHYDFPHNKDFAEQCDVCLTGM